jgi:hypothetical protein
MFRKIASVLWSMRSCGTSKICIRYPKHPRRHVKLRKHIKQIKHGKQAKRHEKLKHGKRSKHPGSVIPSKCLIHLTSNFNPASSRFEAQNGVPDFSFFFFFYFLTDGFSLNFLIVGLLLRIIASKVMVRKLKKWSILIVLVSFVFLNLLAFLVRTEAGRVTETDIRI